MTRDERGSPSSIRSRLLRLGQSRWRRRIQTLSMSARARRTCGRPSPTATGCTSPRTAARHGRLSGWKIRGKSEGFWWTRATRTKFSWRRWGILTGRTRSAECFVRKMEERAGKKLCFTTKTQARLIWRSNREIRRQFTPRCGRREGRRGASIRLRTGRAAGFIARAMEAITGNA